MGEMDDLSRVEMRMMMVMMDRRGDETPGMVELGGESPPSSVSRGTAV